MSPLDGSSPLDMYVGILSPDALQQLKQQRAMQGLYAMGAAYGANSGASHLPITTGQVLGSGVGALANSNAQFDSSIPQQATGPYQVQNAGLQNAQLIQRVKLMQDAMSGTGAFAGQGQFPTQQPPVPPQAAGQGQPPSPQQPGGPLSPQAPGQAPLAGSPTMASAGLLSGNGGPTSPGAPPMPQQPPAQAGAMGGSPDLYRKALISEALVPGSGKSIIDKNTMGYENVREGGVIYGPSGQIVAQNPKIPANYYLGKDANGNPAALPVAGADQGARANAAGQAEAQLPSKQAEAAFNAGLKVTTDNAIAQRTAYYQTGIKPPNYDAPPQPVGISKAQDIITDKGSVVPPPPKAAPFRGTDAILKENENTAKTETSFGQSLSTLQGTESRMLALGKALQVVQSGGLNEPRAVLANKIRGLGLGPLADEIMSAKDTSAVQTAMGLQTLDILGQLKEINKGSGGRILNSEFTNLLEKQYGADMSPQANYTLLTQALGGVTQTKNMIDDYYAIAKPGGHRDANAYMSAYYSKPQNSYQTMVDQAGKAMGPLKGMPGADAPAPGTPTIIKFDARGNRIQ